jgi:hypothetical protein
MPSKGGQKTCRGCRRWKEVRSKMRIAELLGKAAENFAGENPEVEFKPSLAEYLKLVQLEKEFEDEEVKQIKVKWVEPASKKSK